MSVTVRIPTPLRKLTDGQGEVAVDATDLRQAVKQLETRFPGVGDRLLDDDGELRRFVNVFVRDEDVRFLEGLDTKVEDGDTISIVPAVAGGADRGALAPREHARRGSGAAATLDVAGGC